MVGSNDGGECVDFDTAAYSTNVLTYGVGFDTAAYSTNALTYGVGFDTAAYSTNGGASRCADYSTMRRGRKGGWRPIGPANAQLLPQMTGI